MHEYTGAETTGFMSPARDHVDSVIDLADILDLRRPSRYVVRVKGDDLRGRGIRDGDRLVVDATEPAVHGAIAVVFADGDASLAVVCNERGRKVLRTGRGEPIMGDAEIWAVATALIRERP